MFIKKDIRYIGVDDKNIDLFEGMYDVPNGISYNSYIILDKKIAIMDTVDSNFADEWLCNIKNNLNTRIPDYLVVQHMEPDHSSSIMHFMEQFPNTTVVSSAAAFKMMKNYFGTEFTDNRIVITDGSTLDLGKHKLTFITAPMVHWPEVFLSYDSTDKMLFSADAFGKFGALDTYEEWACEARRYYFGIVGKFGAQVQALLKKAASIEIETICPLHGPILDKDLGYYLNLYNTWSSYQPEEDGIMIAYTSVYGNTKNAVQLLAEKLENKTDKKVAVRDLARFDMSEAVEDAFRYSTLVLATTTYNGEIFPFMREFINNLTERNYSNRKIALIENGSWAPTAAKVMKSMLDGCNNLDFCNTQVRILAAVSDDNIKQIDELINELI